MIEMILQAAPAASAQGGSSWSMWVLLILIFVIMWFFMIRPQRKQQKELQNFRNSLKKGDKVVTIGGMYGTILEVKEDSVLLEVDKDVKVRMSKDSIARSLEAPVQSEKK